MLRKIGWFRHQKYNYNLLDVTYISDTFSTYQMGRDDGYILMLDIYFWYNNMLAG